jgi:prepilin-type N-terminal cleavage/methylation domain-containing protein
MALASGITQRRQNEAGFSLLEMAIVLAIGLIVTVVSVMTLVPMMQYEQVTNSYNMTLSAMRFARDNAISQRTAYQVTFSQSGTPVIAVITVSATTAFAGDQTTTTYQLPVGVQFSVPPTGTSSPDSFGTGANAIDFGYTMSSTAGGQTSIYFCPDGSAQTASSCSGQGYWDGGVVYLNRPGNTLSFRAVSLFGMTGRIHGWRLYPSGSNYAWVRN